MNWLITLRQLPAEVVDVEHVPFTPRYHRAWQQLDAILRRGVYLGARDPDEAPSERFLEIAVWMAPTTGRGFGAYCCFRLEVAGADVLAATLFCYYNGDGCPGFRSHRAAAEFATRNGFNEVNA